MNNPENKKARRRQFVDKKLRIRLWIFGVIFLIMTGIGVYDIIRGDLPPWLGGASLLGGFLLGLLVGRAHNVVWHEEAGKAISKMDLFGGLILGAYIVFAIFRKNIIGHWLAGHALSAFVIWLSAGIMLGRLVTLRGLIHKVLQSQGL